MFTPGCHYSHSGELHYRAESPRIRLLGALTFSSPSTGMARHAWYGQPKCHLSEQNLELSLSDFSLLLHPIIQLLISETGSSFVIIRPWQVLGHFTHSDFACLGSPWIWKSLPFHPCSCIILALPNFKILWPIPVLSIDDLFFSPTSKSATSMMWIQLPKFNQSLSTIILPSSFDFIARKDVSLPTAKATI